MTKRNDMDRLPWDKFSWDAWETDVALALCSMGAQGFWMRLLCICAKEGGYLLVSGRAATDDEIAFHTRQPVEKVREWMDELEARRVFSRDRRGVIYSRRMVRDLKKRAVARDNGARGGNPSLRKESGSGASDNPLPLTRERVREEREKERKEAKASSPRTRSRRKPETPLPVGFPDIEAIAIAEGMAKEAGVSLNIPAQAARFRNHAEQNDRRCRDWLAAWRNWILKPLESAPKTGATESDRIMGMRDF